jgi:peroxiredoxin family protein
MVDKDIYPIIYSYLTLQELYEYNIDHNILVRIFKARHIVLVKLHILINLDICEDEFISYKLMTKDESKKNIDGLEEMFSTYKYNGEEVEREVIIDHMKVEKNDFTTEIITDYNQIISFFESCEEGEYSSYLKLFDIISDYIEYNSNIRCSKVKLRFCSIYKYLSIPEKSVLEELSYDENKEVLVKCHFRSTAQTKIMSIKDYNKCIVSIKNKDIKFYKDFCEDELFESEPVCSKFVKLVVDADPVVVKRFRCFFGETDIAIADGCLDQLINECLNECSDE